MAEASKDTVLQFLKDNKDYLCREFHLAKIGLFGSFSRNDYNSDSDIDIGIEFQENVVRVRNIKKSLKKYLSENLSKDIDICNLKYIRPYALHHIAKDIIYV
ncbi:MAG: nucleotidyltransferase family protein [Candidatus Kapaibacteriales bacterium]